MSVAVYPRLGNLLHERNLTVAELGRQIEKRFGMTVDPKTLYRLTETAPIQRADLEISGAVAAILDVGLDDLFDVEASPVETEGEGNAEILDTRQSRRLSELFDRQARGLLSDAEDAELTDLIADYGQRLHERQLIEVARQRGIPVEEAREEIEAQLNQATAWWREFEADPGRRRALASRTRRSPHSKQ